MRYFDTKPHRLTCFKRTLSVFFLLCTAIGATATASATPVLDSVAANGVGDNDGNPFEFTFENPVASAESEFEGVLLEFLDYDSFGISIIDNAGVLVLPLIESSPASTFFFSFVSAASSFTAYVFTEGNGAFGLDIIVVPAVASVPEPGTLGLISLALVGLGWTRRMA